MRMFRLNRLVDPTGISGTGIVAEGCQFSNGWCCLTWLTEHTSVAWYPSAEDVLFIHGHKGDTVVEWLGGVDAHVAAQERELPTTPYYTGKREWYSPEINRWVDETGRWVDE